MERFSDELSIENAVNTIHGILAASARPDPAGTTDTTLHSSHPTGRTGTP